MSTRRVSTPRLLTRRLAWIAVAVLLANLVIVWTYYGADQAALQDEAIERRMEFMETELISTNDGYRIGANARALFDAHPDAYGFVLLGPDKTELDAANRSLVPTDALATSRIAYDWTARVPTSNGEQIVASHTIGPASADLRLVLVARGDPANLTERALVAELIGHIAVPLVPAILLLLGSNALMVHRSLRPVSQAAAWARALHPGAKNTTPPPETELREIDDLIGATSRTLDSLTAALSAEKRRAAEAAHALRTPLAALTARLDQLPDGEAATRLRADMAQLSRTVHQILSSAKADMVTIEPNARADLNAIAENVVVALAPFAIRQGAELELQRHDPVPVIKGESEAVTLALTNLVENAIIHAGGPIIVTVGPGPQITVRDHGPGLPPGNPEDLFEAFRQGPKGNATGAGLGLSIAKRIQRAHRGFMTAANHPGGGAEFQLSFNSG